MVVATMPKRVRVARPGFLSLSASTETPKQRRQRVNKNKKKNWNKHSDINDVEKYLEDVRHQQRTTGGLLSEKSDSALFFLDAGQPEVVEAEVDQPSVPGKKRRKASRPLKIDLILQHDSQIPPPKNVLAYQQPNAKKLRRIAEKAEQTAAKKSATRGQKALLKRQQVDKAEEKETAKPYDPSREYYDIWGQNKEDTADHWYLQQTGKKPVKRPEKLNEKPSALPAVEVIAPGGSYNPDFFSHQALLKDAHEVEVKKQKEEDKVERQLAVRKEDTATEETILQEQVEGLVEEEEEEDDVSPVEEEEDNVATGGIILAQKKTERQRKKEKAEKIKEQKLLSEKRKAGLQQQLFQLRSIKASIKNQEQKTKDKQKLRVAEKEAEKSQPRRLGRLRFHPQDMEVQLSHELSSSLRQLKPEGSVLKDRFKSFQKRNLIEPRERAKFKRKHKQKYQEKRAFREIS